MRRCGPGRLARAGAFTAFLTLLGGCGEPSTGPSMAGIPRYPGATLVESMEASSPLGIVGGSLLQYTTRDSYDDVMAFYAQALGSSDTEVMRHASSLGRQAAITLPAEGGSITVAIQEFEAEGAVNITLMGVGS